MMDYTNMCHENTCRISDMRAFEEPSFSHVSGDDFSTILFLNNMENDFQKAHKLFFTFLRTQPFL